MGLGLGLWGMESVGCLGAEAGEVNGLCEAEDRSVRRNQGETLGAGGGDEDAVGVILVHGVGQLNGFDGDFGGQRKEGDAGFGECLFCPTLESALKFEVSIPFK